MDCCPRSWYTAGEGPTRTRRVDGAARDQSNAPRFPALARYSARRRAKRRGQYSQSLTEQEIVFRGTAPQARPIWAAVSADPACPRVAVVPQLFSTTPPAADLRTDSPDFFLAWQVVRHLPSWPTWYRWSAPRSHMARGRSRGCLMGRLTSAPVCGAAVRSNAAVF